MAEMRSINKVDELNSTLSDLNLKMNTNLANISVGIQQSKETINNIFKRVSDPTLTFYKEMWKEQKSWIIGRRDIQLVIVDSFRYQNIFYRAIHYKEYLRDIEILDHLDSILHKMEVLEEEYLLYKGEYNE